jgi:hypothetical protein
MVLWLVTVTTSSLKSVVRFCGKFLSCGRPLQQIDQRL